MKTKAQCRRDRELIERHHRNRHIKDNGHKLPDIGHRYESVLKDASKKPPENTVGYHTMMAYRDSYACYPPYGDSDYRRAALVLRRIGLVSGSCRLTELGRYYLGCRR